MVLNAGTGEMVSEKAILACKNTASAISKDLLRPLENEQ